MRYHFSALPRRSQIVAAFAALIVVTSPISLVSPAEAMAPSGLKVALPNSSTPVLGWTRVSGATEYQVQVDDDSGFPSPEVQQTTRNSRFVPTTHLSPGTQYWRVTAVKSGVAPSWASSTFSVAAVSVPVPTSPANGEVLPQPDRPPLLRWQTSRGATSYTVEVDGDADFIGAKSYSTKSTSLSVPDALPAGDYFWRVTASISQGGFFGQAFNSVPSAASSFVLGALPAPTLTFPVDDINSAVEDVVFDWEPVPGAATYDLQVATDSTFNNFAFKAEKLYGTRFSPAITLFNDQFWWRVRAVDLAGQPTVWAEARFSFKRQWLDTPQAVYPTGSTAVADGSVATSNGDQFFYQWTPVQHATTYRFEVALDPNFSVYRKECKTAGTTFAPRGSDHCSFAPGVVHYWRVRPMDAPYPDQEGLPGIYSTPQKVKWGAPTAPGPDTTTYTEVTGLKVAMTGVGAASPALGCGSVQCDGLTATPVFKWNKQPGIGYYFVVVGNDENFTTSPLPDLNKYRTTNNYFSLVYEDDKKALADSEAGKPYFWYVIPCNSNGCGPSPVSQNPPLTGAHSFHKRSPAVTGMTSSNPAGTEVAFSWQDYFDTNNPASSSFGEPGQQAARTYRIQVDNEPSFAQPLLDEATVDQATFTSGDRLYPEGTLYWRVQAVDAQENNLTWSATASLTKASPAVIQTSPVGGQARPGSVPLEWQPQAFASAYEVEVYSNNDTAFSPANRVYNAKVANPAYTPSDPIPASASPYIWRVRRLDSKSNPGPWSSTSFVSLGAAPELLTPGNGALQGTSSSYFEWSDVPGAARYNLSIRPADGATQNIGTVATANAPSELQTGSYTWQVTAFDSADKKLGASVTRTFRVDATPPKVLKVKPGKPKPTSDLKVVFSEAVKGISNKTIKLKRANRKGKFEVVKAKVKVKRAGKLAIINPKGRLKKGSYVIVFKNSVIRDGAGNALVDKKVTAPSP